MVFQMVISNRIPNGGHSSHLVVVDEGLQVLVTVLMVGLLVVNWQ